MVCCFCWVVGIMFMIACLLLIVLVDIVFAMHDLLFLIVGFVF